MESVKRKQVAFIGSRDYPVESYGYIADEINALSFDTIVRSGDARGVDSVSISLAKARGLETVVIPADWKTHGVRAGFLRNPDIINPADEVIGLWDGFSKGSLDSIQIALNSNKPVKIILSDGTVFSPLQEYKYRPKKGFKSFMNGSVIYVSGNILDSKASVIVNPCNTMGVAGAGLSAAIMQRYPQLLEPYREACFNHTLEVGKPYFQQGLPTKIKTGTLPNPNQVKSADSPHILHFPTKKDWRNPSQLSFIEEGLAHFVTHFEEYKSFVSTVAFPRLGAGLGGLDWIKVRGLMEQYLSKLPVKVLVFHDKDE